MSEVATTAAPTTPEAAPTGLSVEERASDIFGDAPATPQAPPGEAPAPAAPAEPDSAAKARAARREALAQAQAKERERVDYATAARERDELRAKLKAAEDKATAYATHIDPSKLTKEQFFALAEKNPELTPQELGEWLRERMANPEAAAAKAARSAVDPELAALRKQVADQKAALEQYVQQQQTQAEEAQERAAAHDFFAFTSENASSSPYAAWFLQNKGADQYYAVAKRAAAELPAGVGPQAILDEVEDVLADMFSGTSLNASPQRTQATPPQTHQAPAKAPTNVSNTLAQQRSSVVDEAADLARLSVEERASRIFGL